NETFTYTFTPNVYTVTYKVVNGTWDGTDSADKTEDVVHGQLPVSVPTGMQGTSPMYTHNNGSWSPASDPSIAAILDNETFTYTFTPNVYTVTYKVINGTWDGTDSADKTEDVVHGQLPVSLPTGMQGNSPDFTDNNGTWSPEPSGALITDNVTFTFTFTPNTYTVTYKVVNGTWADGTTADITEIVNYGQSPASLPIGILGNSPEYTHNNGSWSPDPSGVMITDDETFTYTFTPNVYTVTYKVVNGTWDGTDATDKTETVDYGQSPADIPTGMLGNSPAYTQNNGSWSSDPSGATITDNVTFTYTFTQASSSSQGTSFGNATINNSLTSRPSQPDSGRQEVPPMNPKEPTPTRKIVLLFPEAVAAFSAFFLFWLWRREEEEEEEKK
ncbi:MAG: hypothetical protein FWE78_05595, partial [Methanimicrococcus sp.]|nr:hypothetical protein [Methanimicrococcus sp.]